LTGLQDEQDGDFTFHLIARAANSAKRFSMRAVAGMTNGDEAAGKKALKNGLKWLELV